MDEHGAIDLMQHLEADLDDENGTDPDDVAIEGWMMELAQRQTVGNGWLSQRVTVGQDVRRVKELVVPEPADCAGLVIGAYNSLAELRLVKAMKL